MIVSQPTIPVNCFIYHSPLNKRINDMFTEGGRIIRLTIVCVGGEIV